MTAAEALVFCSMALFIDGPLPSGWHYTGLANVGEA
jgi:hypothetical protein